MQYILSIETGADICSVALSRDGELISLRESEQGRNHAQELAVFINEIFTQNDIDSQELSAVAVGMGPGSYTGLRIGVSLAKGICYAGNIPLIAVSSLQSLAMVARDDYKAGILDIDNFDTARLCPMLDARRMEVYAAVYNSDAEPLNEVQAYIIDENSFKEYASDDEFVIFGTGALKCKDIITVSNLKYFDIIPSARGMVTLAHRDLEASKFVDLAYFEPFYLKDFVAAKPKKTLF